MGNRASAAKEEDDVEVSDTEDEDEDDDWAIETAPEILEETYVPKAVSKPVAPKVNTAAIALLRAKAGKKAPKAEPTAAEKIAANARAANAEPEATELPAGCDGAQWKLLESATVRQERDVKSSKKGALQAGEKCFQTGPWRSDPSGRVRMPIRSPKGLVGWVTLDETRCKLATGECGSCYMELVPEVERAPAQEAPKAGAAKASLGDEIDDLLDMYGDGAVSKPVSKPASKPVSKPVKKPVSKPVKKPVSKAVSQSVNQAAVLPVSRAEEEENSDDDYAAPIVEDNTARIAAERELAAAEAAAEAAPPETLAEVEQEGEKVQLSDTQRALRSCRKKVKELEALAAKGKAAGLESLTEAQQEKLAQLKGLRAKAKTLALAAAAEERGEEFQAAPKKRRPKKGAAKGEVAQTSSGSSGPLLAILVVVCGAVIAWYMHGQ